MKEFPIFDFDDILLRKLSLDDYESYLSYVSDEDIKKQFLFNYDDESCKKRLEEIVNRYSQENIPYIWVIALKDTNEFIGIISFDRVSFSNKNFSIACGIVKNYRNKGYAYKAAYALIDYMFNNTDMHRVQLAHSEGNIASEKIFAKLGATFEGVARESKYFDGVFKNRKVYSILKEEWIER